MCYILTVGHFIFKDFKLPLGSAVLLVSCLCISSCGQHKNHSLAISLDKSHLDKCLNLLNSASITPLKEGLSSTRGTIDPSPVSVSHGYYSSPGSRDHSDFLCISSQSDHNPFIITEASKRLLLLRQAKMATIPSLRLKIAQVLDIVCGNTQDNPGCISTKDGNDNKLIEQLSHQIGYIEKAYQIVSNAKI